MHAGRSDRQAALLARAGAPSLFAEASVAEVVLQPGDCIFIPAGWSHWVKSLDASISATCCNFHVAGGNTALRRD